MMTRSPNFPDHPIASRPVAGVEKPGDVRGNLARLQDEVHQLRELLRRIESSRRHEEQRRRRRLIRIGVAVSIVAHLVLMVYLATRFKPGSPGSQAGVVTVEFATITQEELTDLRDVSLEELPPQDLSQFEQVPTELLSELDPASAVTLETGDLGSLPLLGGAGEGESDPSMAGGGAGVSFFGISSRGRRFAYVVDRSGSMGNDEKMDTAKRELTRSIKSLPDYAQFYVVFFSNDVAVAPMQRSWLAAKAHIINNFITWLRNVEPMGGTMAGGALRQVFSLDVRPDVIFLLTDGQFSDISPEEIRDINRRGTPVVINTIAFGEPTGQDELRRIAADSGGVYRFVPSTGN